MLDPLTVSSSSRFRDLIDDATRATGFDESIVRAVLYRIALDEPCAIAFGLDPYNDLESMREELADLKRERNELAEASIRASNDIRDLLDNRATLGKKAIATLYTIADTLG